MTSDATRSNAAWRQGAPVMMAAGAAILIWGATPMVTRIAVLAIDPMAVGILRTVLAALIAVPLALAFRLPLPHGRGEWTLLAISAVGGFIVFPILFSVGVRQTSASHAALIIAAAPLITGVIGGGVERRRPSVSWWLGAALALAGEVVLIAFRVGIGGGDASIAGDLMVLAANVGSASGYVAGAQLARRITTASTTFWGIGLGGLILLPVLPVTLGPWAWSGAGLGGWSAMAYLALGATILGYVCWYWALQRGGIVRIGTMQFLQPVIALALAVLVLGEELSVKLGMAALLIVAGVALAQRK